MEGECRSGAVGRAACRGGGDGADGAAAAGSCLPGARANRGRCGWWHSGCPASPGRLPGRAPLRVGGRGVSTEGPGCPSARGFLSHGRACRPLGARPASPRGRTGGHGGRGTTGRRHSGRPRRHRGLRAAGGGWKQLAFPGPPAGPCGGRAGTHGVSPSPRRPPSPPDVGSAVRGDRTPAPGGETVPELCPRWAEAHSSVTGCVGARLVPVTTTLQSVRGEPGLAGRPTQLGPLAGEDGAGHPHCHRACPAAATPCPLSSERRISDGHSCCRSRSRAVTEPFLQLPAPRPPGRALPVTARRAPSQVAGVDPGPERGLCRGAGTSAGKPQPPALPWCTRGPAAETPGVPRKHGHLNEHQHGAEDESTEESDVGDGRRDCAWKRFPTFQSQPPGASPPGGAAGALRARAASPTAPHGPPRPARASARP